MEATLIEYKKMPYKSFIAKVNKCYEEYKQRTGKTESDLAVCIQKSSMSVRNCLQPIKQMVSDKILTNFINCIGMKAKIEWVDGERYYYCQNN